MYCMYRKEITRETYVHVREMQSQNPHTTCVNVRMPIAYSSIHANEILLEVACH